LLLNPSPLHPRTKSPVMLLGLLERFPGRINFSPPEGKLCQLIVRLGEVERVIVLLIDPDARLKREFSARRVRARPAALASLDPEQSPRSRIIPGSHKAEVNAAREPRSIERHIM